MLGRYYLAMQFIVESAAAEGGRKLVEVIFIFLDLSRSSLWFVGLMTVLLLNELCT